MRISVSVVLSFSGSVCFGTVFGQLTGTGVMTPPSYNTLIRPGTGNTMTDPVFGSTIKRSRTRSLHRTLSGGYLTWIENEYSTTNAFNNDNSNFILLHESYFALHDGTTGLYIHDLPFQIDASSEPRWSRNDLVTIYYHYGNSLMSYNISTGGIDVVHTFSAYSAINGLGEMDISRWRSSCFCGR